MSIQSFNIHTRLVTPHCDRANPISIGEAILKCKTYDYYDGFFKILESLSSLHIEHPLRKKTLLVMRVSSLIIVVNTIDGFCLFSPYQQAFKF